MHVRMRGGPVKDIVIKVKQMDPNVEFQGYWKTSDNISEQEVRA